MRSVTITEQSTAATWVAPPGGQGHALRFDGVNDYVDCGRGPSLDITGPITLEAWVHPDALKAGEPGMVGKFFSSYALTYYKGSAYFYFGGGNNGANGPLKTRRWSHVVGVCDGKHVRIYVNGRQTHERPSRLAEMPSGANFYMGAIFGDPDNIDKALRSMAFFPGMIDSVRVYNRALNDEEIVRRFNEEASAKGHEPFDTSVFGKLMVKPYVYPERNEVILEINHQWVALQKTTPIRVGLYHLDQATPLATVDLVPSDRSNVVEATFSLKGITDGRYWLVASSGAHKASAEFTLPATKTNVPSPDQHIAKPLPQPVVPPKYRLRAADWGGFTVVVGDQSFPVESTYSFPHGGDNGLLVRPRKDLGSESQWKVNTRRLDATTHQVTGAGRYYAIRRVIRSKATRIEVEDTLTNKTDDVVGIILSNHVNKQGLAGATYTLPGNPTAFVASRGRGVGIIALDDLYYLQLNNRHHDDLVELRDEHFGLKPGASYTIRWAVYPTATDNYYDFINQVRKDEGINGHVAGGLTLSAGWVTLSRDEVRIKDLKYLSQCYLTGVTSNPKISLEGWEFLEYPKIAARIKQTLAASRSAHTDLQVGFHVAHALYATDTPDRFADSKAIDADGNQVMYGPDSLDYYGKYFSKELVEKGWRWWIYYPTMRNSFGRLMLEAADAMINELGATMIWADGYISGYVKGNYTYDHFDGHSVTIDPKTKLVTRKKANVTYTALPVLKAVARKFAKAGGTLISNGRVGPPSYWAEKTITSNETGSGDQQPISNLHLGKTVTPLGNPGVNKNMRDIYRDVLAKLDHGALYFWYGETDHRPGGHNYVHEESIVTHMYPITFENIQPGVVRGTERIVTNRSGVYGWYGDQSLHVAHLSDARGRIIPNRFVTTVDTRGVRTEVDLAKNEAVAIEKIPIRIESPRPVNLIVNRYDKSGLRIELNGKGDARLRILDGRFNVTAGSTYRVTVGRKTMQVVAQEPMLDIQLPLAGPTEVRVRVP